MKEKKHTHELEAVIMVCKNCGKVDILCQVCHDKECDPAYEAARQENLDYYD